MSFIRFGLLGALGALAVLVLMPPAHWLESFLPPPFHFQYASGTLWAGQVVLSGERTICPVAWKYAGFAKRTVSVDVSLGAPCSGRAVLDLTPEGAALRDLELALPSSLVVQLLPKLQSWQVGGQFSLQSPRLDIAPLTQGEGNLTWTGAQLARLPIATLGDYEARFTLRGQTLEARVSTLQGPLKLEGEIGFAGKPRVNVLASSTDAKVGGWIRTLGIMESPGNYRLRMD